MPLTKKQKDFFDLVVKTLLRLGRPPTLRELQQAGGFASSRSVAQFLEALEKAGLIEKGRGSRNLRIVFGADSNSATTQMVPLVGTVAAGLPILAEQNIVDYRQVANKLLRPGHRHYLLKVSGDSMDRAGIRDGDLVLVREQSSAAPGEKVVALIDEAATVKRLRIGSGAVVLEPVSFNPAHKPIVLNTDFRIQGVIIATLPASEDPALAE